MRRLIRQSPLRCGPDDRHQAKGEADQPWVVEARGVTKWYGETVALDGVDLVVGPGEIHGLLGPNGAGKTTLLSVLFGLALPDAGSLLLFGRTRTEAGAGWLDGVGGFVEAPRFYPYLSGRKNLEFFAHLDDDDATGLINDLLELVGLGEAAGEKVRGYSLGMRQRLGLAAAMLRRPRLLVLDEPTNGMDPAGIRDLRVALRLLAERGMTVVLSSHDMSQVEELCRSVTVLKRGRVVFEGSIDQMRAGAPHPAWRLSTSDDAASAAVCSGMDNIVASSDEGGLVVVATEAGLHDLIGCLVEADIALRGLALAVAPLESMFFELTRDRPIAPSDEDGR
jgi:ABC-2 type transport system ATP-binding protein